MISNDIIADDNQAAQQAYENKQLWLDAAKKIPGVGLLFSRVTQILGAGDELEDIFVGKRRCPSIPLRPLWSTPTSSSIPSLNDWSPEVPAAPQPSAT